MKDVLSFQDLQIYPLPSRTRYVRELCAQNLGEKHEWIDVIAGAINEMRLHMEGHVCFAALPQGRAFRTKTILKCQVDDGSGLIDVHGWISLLYAGQRAKYYRCITPQIRLRGIDKNLFTLDAPRRRK